MMFEKYGKTVVINEDRRYLDICKIDGYYIISVLNRGDKNWTGSVLFNQRSLKEFRKKILKWSPGKVSYRDYELELCKEGIRGANGFLFEMPKYSERVALYTALLNAENNSFTSKGQRRV